MRFDLASIGVKLWLYFILFAAVILITLWLMQIVFLQNFYQKMKTADIADIADTIADKYGEEDFQTTVDRITFRNAVLVFVTDLEGNVIYVSDEHGGGGEDGGQKPGSGAAGLAPLRSLPTGYDHFIARLNQSESGYVSYTVQDDRFQGKSLIYGAKLADSAILYISTPMDAVNSTTEILRVQLLYVTAASLLLSLIIAFFIARKFSKPVSAISKQAEKLAEREFDVVFDKGFCSELDGLASTLDHAAVELSKVEKLRRELLSNISHDLRTPLTMVKAYAEMVRDISGDNKEKREAHLAVIISEADRLSTLVNDILELSVIQSGTETLEIQSINLSDMTRRIISRFKPLFEHEGYAFALSLQPDQYVMGDEQKLTQVLYNLIGNAMNYIGEDNVIAVTLQDLGSGVRFEVTDHGDGIPGEDLPVIWDRYYRVKAYKRAKAGTGLGLSIVKNILELHGARYGVVSAISEGSTFWFELKK